MKKSVFIFLLILLFSLFSVATVSGKIRVVKSFITNEDAQQYTPQLNAVPVTVLRNDNIKQQPSYVKFVSRDVFSANAKIIDFEDLKRGKLVTDQYSKSHGVLFVPEQKQELIIVNSEVEDEFYLKYLPQSGKNALLAMPQWPWTSKFVPLNMEFNAPKKRVGFYIGNGIEYWKDNVAYIKAFDKNGKQVGVTLLYEHFPNDVQTFIGVEATGAGISRISLDLGKTNLPELIDDVVIDENYVTEIVPRADVYINKLHYNFDKIIAVVCNKGQASTSNFQVQFILNSISSTSQFKGEILPTQCVEIFSKPYHTTFKVSDELYPIKAKVDPKDYLIEENENNNEFVRKVAKELAPVIHKQENVKNMNNLNQDKPKQKVVDNETEGINENILPDPEEIPVEEFKTQPPLQELGYYCEMHTDCLSAFCSKNRCTQKGVLIRFFNWVLGR